MERSPIAKVKLQSSCCRIESSLLIVNQPLGPIDADRPVSGVDSSRWKQSTPRSDVVNNVPMTISHSYPAFLSFNDGRQQKFAIFLCFVTSSEHDDVDVDG